MHRRCRPPASVKIVKRALLLIALVDHPPIPLVKGPLLRRRRGPLLRKQVIGPLPAWVARVSVPRSGAPAWRTVLDLLVYQGLAVVADARELAQEVVESAWDVVSVGGGQLAEGHFPVCLRWQPSVWQGYEL